MPVSNPPPVPFTATRAGIVAGSGGGTVNFLRADDTWDAPPGTGAGLTVGTTTITSGTSGEYLFDNAGVLGNQALPVCSNSVQGIAEVDGITIGASAGVIFAGTIGTVASNASITPSAVTQYNVTALAVGTTINAPSGSPVDGQKLIIRIKDNASSQTLAWNAIYRVITGITLPTATLGSSLPLYVGCIYNAQDTKWDVVAAS